MDRIASRRVTKAAIPLIVETRALENIGEAAGVGAGRGAVLGAFFGLEGGVCAAASVQAVDVGAPAETVREADVVGSAAVTLFSIWVARSVERLVGALVTVGLGWVIAFCGGGDGGDERN